MGGRKGRRDKGFDSLFFGITDGFSLQARRVLLCAFGGRQ